MQQRRRLNLFAFTPETDALFGMLIIASIALALFLGIAFGAFLASGIFLQASILQLADWKQLARTCRPFTYQAQLH